MLQKEKGEREKKKLSCASNLYKFEKSNNSCATVSSLYFNLHSLQCSFPNCNSARKLVVLIQNVPPIPLLPIHARLSWINFRIFLSFKGKTFCILCYRV